MAPPEPVRVDRELDDGDLVDLGGGAHAVAVAAPGHPPAVSRSTPRTRPPGSGLRPEPGDKIPSGRVTLTSSC
ncbi:hypothetical protein [Actinomadura decatromicini]|uniref:hypothetical protein n=1 Tax=Actinomadura decatromicini TaxID=2604572 RepID=UPI001CA36C0F|nr:hypothetical protein [Actinomadura decatromicini]